MVKLIDFYSDCYLSYWDPQLWLSQSSSFGFFFFLLTLAFALQWLSLHWKILIMLFSQFPLTFFWLQKKVPLFIAQLIITLVLIGMMFNILERFHGRISINFASAATTKFCKWVQVGIDVYIPHLKLQVKLHWSLWFSAACPAVIAHRNHLFCLCQQSKFYASKVKFRQLCPLYLMALCCLLHLIKKNCLLKTFLRTLVD